MKSRNSRKKTKKPAKKTVDKGRRLELIGLLLAILGVLMLLSLLSYESTDWPNSGRRDQVQNWMGPAGAWVSYYLYIYSIGYPALVIPFLITYWGLVLMRAQGAMIALRRSGYILFFAFSFSVAFALPRAIQESSSFTYEFNGTIGLFFAQILFNYLGAIGSVLVLFTAMLFVFLSITDVSISGIFHRLGEEAAFFKTKVVSMWQDFQRRQKLKRDLRMKKRDMMEPPPKPERPKVSAPTLQKEPPAISHELAEPESKFAPKSDRARPVPVSEHFVTEAPAQDDHDPDIMASKFNDFDQRLEKDALQSTPVEPVDLPVHSDFDIPTARPPGADAQPVTPAADLPPNEPSDVTFDFEEMDKTAEPIPPLDASLTESQSYDDLIPDDYEFPPPDLLDEPPRPDRDTVKAQLLQEARVLEEKLGIYGIEAKVVQIHPGPIITQFEVEPAEGVKVARFQAIADDLAMVLMAPQIRILAPIPGKAAVGIEIPNRSPQIISFRQVMNAEKFRDPAVRLPLALGVEPTGKPYIADLVKMPHLLIAGSTGTGKSVCLNSIIASMLYRMSPEDLKLILIDPKRLELSGFADLRGHHLITLRDLNEEVVTTPQNAITILGRVWQEMEKRFGVLATAGVRTLEDYNDRLSRGELNARAPDQTFKRFPYIVVIIDELADLLMASAQEIEEPIGRLAHKARAVGIHLIVATQRPSTDVITGAIKANFPCRIAFKVFSKTDSRVVLDFNGAERLLGRGDMLFLPPGQPQPIRLHGPFISVDEANRVVKHVYNQSQFPEYKLPEMVSEGSLIETPDGRKVPAQRDSLFYEALKLVVRHDQGSISLLQRRLRVGYARAARLVDELELAGFVGPPDGSKAREVLVSEDELDEMGVM